MTIKTIIYRYRVVLILLLLSSFARAGIITRNNAFKGTAIATNAILVLQEDLYSYTIANPNPLNWDFADKRTDNQVFLRFTGADKTYYASAWAISVNVKIEGYTKLGTSLPVVNTVLQINYDPAMPYQDIATYAMSGAHRIKTTIMGVTLSSNFGGIMPADVVLENEIEIERYYNLPYLFSPAPTLNNTAIAANNSTELYWSYVTGAEEYDLEYILVSQYVSPQPASPSIVDFSNATRISTRDNFYKLNLAYDNGKVYYRFRAVGVGGTNFDSRLESEWKYCPAPITISTNFHTPSNWNYAATFAEDGKSSETVNFFDGSQRVRQSVTLNNSDNASLITENFYDFEGREVVQTLPAPTNNLNNTLGYYPSFNLNGSGTFYRKSNFENGSCTNNYPMGTGSGASNYYSPANAFYANVANDKTFFPALPDAFQYPMIRTTYNNESEPQAVSGAGNDFKIGSGKETMQFKAPASQEKLDRLFGNEVGYAQHYSEEVSIDPNGQVSVTYKNLSGKVVATAMRGESPTNVTTLDNQANPTDEPYMAGEYTKEDFTILNQRDDSRNGFIVSKDFMVTNAGPINAPNPYTFNYQISPQTFNDLCVNQNFSCKYLLKISIMDNCGGLITALAPNASLLNTYIPVDPVLYPGGYNVTFVVNFPANGIYKIQKELILDPAAIAAYVLQYQALARSPANTCISSINQLETTLSAEIDLEECSTCEAWAEKLTDNFFAPQILPHNDPTWIAQYKYTLIDACTPEKTEKSCDALMALLKDDVSPGGQYFKTIFPAGSVFTKGPSVWTAGSNLGWVEATALINTGFLTDFQNYCSSNNCSPSPPSVGFSQAWVAANWNDCFAGFLVQYHPEYCRYLKCVTLQASDTYDYLLQTLNYTSAQNTNGSGFYCSGCGVLNISGSPVGSSVLSADPIAAINPAHATAIGAELSNCTSCAGMANSAITGCIPAGSTMWDYTDCVPIALNPLSPTYLDQRWNNFVTLYTSYKKTLQSGFMCPGLSDASPQPGDLISDNYTSSNNVGQAVPQSQLHIRLNGMDIRDPDLVLGLQNVQIAVGPSLPPGFAPHISRDSCLTNQSVSNPPQLVVFSNGEGPSFEHNGENYLFPAPPSEVPCPDGITSNGMQFYVNKVPGITGKLYISDRINIPDDHDSLTGARLLEILAEGINSYVSEPDFTALVDDSHPGAPELKIYAAADLSPLLMSEPQMELGAKRYAFCDDSDSSTIADFMIPWRYCIDPPPECICNLLNQLHLAFINASPPIAGSEWQYMADALNELFYAGSSVIAATQAQYWYANCQTSGYTPYPIDLARDPIVPAPGNFYEVPGEVVCEPPCNVQAEEIVDYTVEDMHETGALESIQTFIKNYVTACLSNINEEFNVEYYEKEYHYTLYYYDQAGNLVRTVPPAAVNRIPSASLYAGGNNIVHAARVANSNFIYTGHSRLGQNSSYPSPGVQPANSMVTNYLYNSYNQLKKQETPDGGATSFWYDDLGRLRFSQNSKQAIASCYSGVCGTPGSLVPYNGLYSYTIYDNLNRIIEVGENQSCYTYLSGTPPFQVINNVSFPSGVNEQSFPTFDGIQVTKTYYSAPIPNSPAGNQFTGGQANLRNRVATTSYEEVEDANALSYQHATHYSYDIHGNVKTLVQENPDLVVLKEQYKKMDYEYDLISGKVNKVSYQAGRGDQFYHRYYYDAANRLTSAYSSCNNVIWNREARYFYYLHGPLARVETGNEKVQGMDYVYTLQGWMKLANASVLDADIDLGKDGNTLTAAQYKASQPELHDNVARDAMAFALDYYNSDYRSIQSGLHTILTANVSANASYNSTAGLYNGNIRALSHAFLNPLNEQPVPVLSRWFAYDQLNRIKTSNTYIQSAATNNLGTSLAATADYAETFRYDANGNIKATTRNGYTGGGFNNSMDNMSYAYAAGSNKLTSVSDAGDNANDPLSNFGDIKSQAVNNYAYDAIGNLTTDNQSQIASIEWTVYGKIKRITRSVGASVNAPDLEFQYDAAGNRVCKITKPRVAGVLSKQESWTYTYYIRDAQGNVMAVYDRDYTKVGGSYSDYLRLKEQHIYGSSRIGMLNRNEAMVFRNYAFTGYDTEGRLQGISSTAMLFSTLFNLNQAANNPGNKSYELNNHLGNAISVISDRKLPVDANTNGIIDYYVPDAIQSNDYYAFGAFMPGRQYNSNGYRYGFNGKENDNEAKGTGNQQDYGMRIYDPRLGRFLSTDPLTRSFPMLTPYQFANNRPVDGIDVDGLERLDYRLTYHDNKPQLDLQRIDVNRSISLPPVISVDYNGEQYMFSTVKELKQFVDNPSSVKSEREQWEAKGWGDVHGVELAMYDMAFAAPFMASWARSAGKLEGGAYSALETGGKDRHHLISGSEIEKAELGVTRDEATAIRMEVTDHALTGSFGNTRAARAFRKAEGELMKQGKFMEAFELGVNDVYRVLKEQGKDIKKYEGAINQAREHFTTKILPKLEEAYKKANPE